jgi:glycosyltransferase involved in cell wall biosynthesis
MDVSIIICTRNRADSLKHTLVSIGRMSVPPGWTAELLIVDNGSTDHTPAVAQAARLRNLAVRYLCEPKSGVSHARNTGVAEASGQIIIFTDDDIRVPVNWIEGMCGPIRKEMADAVAGQIRPAPHLERPWLKGMLRAWLAAVEFPSAPPDLVLVGANMAFHRRAFDAAGGFDPRLGPGAAGFGDDTLFALAVKRAGMKIFYQSSISVEHHFDSERLKLRSFINTARRMAVSHSIMEKTLDPNCLRPPISVMIRRLPGLGYRCATQTASVYTTGAPDEGFLWHYYQFCLWFARRKRDRNLSTMPDLPSSKRDRSVNSSAVC